MKLYIAEKPSLGRAIAAALPKPHKKEQGFIRVANGDCVSWCIGHLLEQVEPEHYDPAYKQWRLQDLPIIPEQWQLQPKKKTAKQLTVLRKLSKQATALVHAGDPDREGQLLVDQVISYLGVSSDLRNSVQRCLINDLNPSAVSRALGQLKSNQDYYPLSISALARSRADWLYGINMTRVYTLQGRKAGYDGVLSVGRVQTPILGLVVRRDQEIESFQSRPYFEVLANLEGKSSDGKSSDGKSPEGKSIEGFSARWKPSEACEPHMDQDGRVTSKALAENVVRRIEGRDATVREVTNKQGQQHPPLPYNLSSLQIDAARLFGMSAKQTLEVCQALYEKYQLVTYPRSDCRYLPTEQHRQASTVISAVTRNCAGQKAIPKPLQAVTSRIDSIDQSLKSRAWNDSKVDAHHAIIPTLKQHDLGKLSGSEVNVYALVVRQYLCQFLLPARHADVRIEVEIEAGLFVAKSRQSLQEGWTILFRNTANPDDEKALPDVKKGQQLLCTSAELQEKQTRPPGYFTEATLLSAMTGISRYVSDTKIKKILKETDGLGTEATRAGILDLLFKRGFLVREGRGKVRQIKSTRTGQTLIQALPDSATRPDMTAHWESQLNAISRRSSSYDGFMQPLTRQLEQMVQQGKLVLTKDFQALKGNPGKAGVTRSKRGKGKRSRTR
jgi:DNA topoisomerase-3